jgi:hypothetical protein
VRGKAADDEAGKAVEGGIDESRQWGSGGFRSKGWLGIISGIRLLGFLDKT